MCVWVQYILLWGVVASFSMMACLMALFGWYLRRKVRRLPGNAYLLGTDKPLSKKKQKRLESKIAGVFNSKALPGTDNTPTALQQAGVAGQAGMPLMKWDAVYKRWINLDAYKEEGTDQVVREVAQVQDAAALKRAMQRAKTSKTGTSPTMPQSHTRNDADAYRTTSSITRPTSARRPGSAKMGAPVAPPTSTGKEFKRQFKPMNLSAVEAMSEREIRSALEARGADHTDCTTIDHLKDRLKEVACAAKSPLRSQPKKELPALLATRSLQKPDEWFASKESKLVEETSSSTSLLLGRMKTSDRRHGRAARTSSKVGNPLYSRRK